MSQRNFNSVATFIEFVRGVQLPPEGDARALGYSQHDDRYKMMLEEVEEFAAADNLDDQVDALVDLQYFLYGTLLEMGVSYQQWNECFERVHSANMAKKAGRKPGRDVASVDAAKPSDWTPPNFEGIF